MLWEEMLTLLVFTLEKVKGISRWRHSNQNAQPFICKGQAADCSPHPDGVWAPGLGTRFRAGLDLNLSPALSPFSCAGGRQEELASDCPSGEKSSVKNITLND